VSVRELTLHAAEIVPPMELVVHARFAAGTTDAATFRCSVDGQTGLHASAMLTVYQPEVSASDPEKA
jgi:hypothetical protein